MSDHRLDALTQQHQAIREEYKHQAAFWGKAAVSAHLTWVAQQLELAPHLAVLDVAAGTGLFSQAIAAHVARITALDITPEMLEQGRVQARQNEVSNITFQQGAAEDLPFPRDSFDLVMTRYTVHHFLHPTAVLKEMTRVCRAGGTVVVVDMVASEDPEIAARQNHLERLADPTHTKMLSPSVLIACFAEAQLHLDKHLSHDVEMTFDQWQSHMPADAEARQVIRRALEDEIAGAGETGFRPFLADGTLKFVHTWGVVIGRKREAHV